MKGTIKSKKDIERLFQHGRRSSSSSMTLLSLDSTTCNKGRCAFIAGKKLGNAPFRSRCKRVLRAAAHECGAPWDGKDVAFVARKSVGSERHDLVVKQMRTNLKKLGIIDD